MTTTPAPRVIGLDLSLTVTGVAMPDGTTNTITTRAADGDRRLVHITHAISQILADRSDLVVVEDLPIHARSAGILGMVHGAVRVAILEAGVPYLLITPATLKAYATGRGNAVKAALMLAAYKRAGVEFADDNQCDAWWLRAAGLDILGQPVVELPQVQRDRMRTAVTR